MKYDKLIKQTIDNYCKLFNITKEEFSKNLNEITEEDKILIKHACEMKIISIEEFKKEHEVIE